MNWQEILLSVLGVVLTTVVAWGCKTLISLAEAKVKNAKAASLLTNAIDIIARAVKTTYQTYVESLKAEGKFDIEAQKEALDKSKESALGQLSGEAKTYITDNFGDIDKWVESTIESVIYDLKNKKE